MYRCEHIHAGLPGRSRGLRAAAHRQTLAGSSVILATRFRTDVASCTAQDLPSGDGSDGGEERMQWD